MNNANTSVQAKTSIQPTSAPAAQTSAVTILLTNHQTALMDEIAAAIRRNTGQVLSRSGMVRAISSAVLPFYEDWLHCRSQAELQQKIARRLQVGGPK